MLPRIAVTVDMTSRRARHQYRRPRRRHPGREGQDRFVTVDCVGLSEHDMDDTRPLEKSPGVSFDKLLDHVASGGTNPELLSSLASRLSRLELQLDARDRARIRETCGDAHLPAITHGLVEALDVDRQLEHARIKFNAAEPSDAQLAAAAKELLAAAAGDTAAVLEIPAAP